MLDISVGLGNGIFCSLLKPNIKNIWRRETMSDKVSGFVCGFALGLIYACVCISRANITIVTGSEKKEEKEESHD